MTFHEHPDGPIAQWERNGFVLLNILDDAIVTCEGIETAGTVESAAQRAVALRARMTTARQYLEHIAFAPSARAVEAGTLTLFQMPATGENNHLIRCILRAGYASEFGLGVRAGPAGLYDDDA